MVKKAMILAAGYGTRLKEITKDTPKALVLYKGKPMISHVIERLELFGIENIVINCHHFGEKLEEHFSKNIYKTKIDLIFEKEILGTGGGIKNAAGYLQNEKDFLVYNADVISDVDLNKMYEYHVKNEAFATLALQNRDTSRPLIIDEKMNIIGRKSINGFLKYKTPIGEEKLTGFCGIHFISAKIFENFTESGFFDIFTSYFRLIKEGKTIIGFGILNSSWIDIGTPENLYS